MVLYMFYEISAELGLEGKSFYVVVTSRIAWFAQCALSVGTKWGGDKTQSDAQKIEKIRLLNSTVGQKIKKSPG